MQHLASHYTLVQWRGTRNAMSRLYIWNTKAISRYLHRDRLYPDAAPLGMWWAPCIEVEIGRDIFFGWGGGWREGLG